MAKKRGLCTLCKENPQEPTRGKYRSGVSRTTYKALCASCNTKKKRKKITDYVRQDYCEACGDRPLIKQLLQIDHLDGSSSNNDLKNYWTLCVTCHQIKSVIEQKNRQILGLSDRINELELELNEKEKAI